MAGPYDELEDFEDPITGRRILRNKATGETLVLGQGPVAAGDRPLGTEGGAIGPTAPGSVDKGFEADMAENTEFDPDTLRSDEDYIENVATEGDTIEVEQPDEMEFTVEETEGEPPVQEGETRERRVSFEGYPKEALELASRATERRTREQAAEESQYRDEISEAWAQQRETIREYQSDLSRMEEKWQTMQERSIKMARQSINANRFWNNAGNYNRAAVMMGAVANGILKVRTGRGGGNDVIETLMKRIEMDNAEQLVNIKMEREAFGMEKDALAREESVTAQQYVASTTKFQTLIDMAKKKRDSLAVGSQGRYNMEMLLAEMMRKKFEFEEKSRLDRERIAAARARRASGRGAAPKRDKYGGLPVETPRSRVAVVVTDPNDPNKSVLQVEPDSDARTIRIPFGDKDIPAGYLNDKWYSSSGEKKQEVVEFIDGLKMFRSGIDLLDASSKGRCEDAIGRVSQYINTVKGFAGMDCFEKAKAYINYVLSPIKNKLYGATLSEGEEKAWQSFMSISGKQASSGVALDRAKHAYSMLSKRMNMFKQFITPINYHEGHGKLYADPDSERNYLMEPWKNPAMRKAGLVDAAGAKYGRPIKGSGFRKNDNSHRGTKAKPKVQNSDKPVVQGSTATEPAEAGLDRQMYAKSLSITSRSPLTWKPEDYENAKGLALSIGKNNPNKDLRVQEQRLSRGIAAYEKNSKPGMAK